jgi:hypothetical protein
MGPSVDEIAGMGDPVLRNLWITQRYHELAVQLRDAGLAEDATWCAFAVWASKTAGATIRGEELPARVRDILDLDEAAGGATHQFNGWLGKWDVPRLEREHLAQVVDELTGQVAASIAAGNVMVFSELAPLFTILVEGAAAASAAERAATVATLRSALDAMAAEGIDTETVAAAFDVYVKALDPAAHRPTLVLGANILAVSHEQERLQPNIATALDAAVSDVFKKMVDQQITRHLPIAGLRHGFDRMVTEVGQVLERAWQSALTAMMLRLETSDERLELHRDVPPLADGLYPPELTDLEGSEAEGPFRQWDRTAGVGEPTGANDWAELEERMNYIVNLFRSRQRHPALFSPPFSDDQLTELAAGRLPAPPL